MQTDHNDPVALITLARAHGCRLTVTVRLVIDGPCPDWLRRRITESEGAVVAQLLREQRQREAATVGRW